MFNGEEAMGPDVTTVMLKLKLSDNLQGVMGG